MIRAEHTAILPCVEHVAMFVPAKGPGTLPQEDPWLEKIPEMGISWHFNGEIICKWGDSELSIAMFDDSILPEVFKLLIGLQGSEVT